MKILSIRILSRFALILFISMMVPTFASAGIPLEVGLYKSSLLKLNKKMVLVTLANTKKDEKDKDAEIIAKYDKMDTERRRDSGPSNTNKFVTVEILSPTDLKIDGISLGSTTMIVWSKGDGDEKPKPDFYDITVISDQKAHQLPNILALKNKSTEGQFIDIADIKNIIREKTNEEGIEVSLVDDTIFLTGTVKHEFNILKAVTIAKSYAVKETIEDEETEVGGVRTTKRKYEYKIQDFLQTESPNQVLLEIKVAQVDKNSLKSLGMSWLIKGNSGEGFTNLVGVPSGGATVSTTSTSSLGGVSQQVGTGTGISGNVTGLGSFNPLDGITLGGAFFDAGVGVILKALATKGYAKILAEPNLLVKSGNEGKFHAGSRIPYSIVTSVGGTSATTIQYESVGIKITFRPEVLENGLINLKIDPAEVSSIAGTMAVNGYPIIDTRTVQTNVELKDGESLVMAGLLQEEAIKTMSKIPFLGDIPILGALFRSTQDDLKEKELVFFVTPKIVKPTAPGVKTKLPTDDKLTPEQEEELRWMPLGS